MGDREKHEQQQHSPRRTFLSRSESRREARAAASPFGWASYTFVLIAGTVTFVSCLYWIVSGLAPAP
jgi:hypothetical protein